MKTLSIITLYISCTISVYSQTELVHPYYEHFNASDGLAGNEAYFIYQDRDNYIWTCTNNGVSKFDGVQFKNYNTQEGLCFNVVFGCVEDERGNLWFYSYTGELSVYNKKKDRFECPDFNDSLSRLLEGRVILAVAIHNDTMYISTVGYCFTVHIAHTGTAAIKKIAIPKHTVIFHILDRGKPYIMYGLSGKEKEITLIIKGIVRDTISKVLLKGKLNLCFASNSIGNDYFAIMGENLLKYNLTTNTLHVEKTPFLCTPNMGRSQSGLVCGSYYNGLWQIKVKNSTTVFRQLLKDVSISAAIQDNLGGIWGSSQENGIFHIPSLLTLSSSKKAYAGNESISSICSGKDTAFYTTYNGGLYMLRKAGEDIYKEQLLNNRQKVTIYEYAYSELLLKHIGGIFRYLPASNTITKTNHQKDLFNASKIQGYLKHDSLLTKFVLQFYDKNRAKEMVIPGEWNHGKLRTIVAGTSKIFLANIFDLFVFDTTTKVLSRIGKPQGFHHLNPRCILPLGGDSAVIGTNYGVFVIVGDQIIKKVSFIDGLSSNSVFDILKDEEDFWIATSSGIDYIKNLLKKDKPEIQSISYMSGINLCPTSHLVSMDNFIISGTDQGVYIFDKKQMIYDTISVAPKITSLRVNNTQIKNPSKGQIRLSYNKNSLIIEYTSMNFRNAMHNHYRYRLFTRDSAWQYTNQNKIIFSSISPGEYLFELQAMNPNGRWNTQSLQMGIVVSLPFWQTWWFVFLCICTGIMAVYYFYQNRIHQLKQVNALKNGLTEAKFQALGMQLNPHFIFNALHSVSSHMARNDVKSTLKFLGKFARLMRIIFRNSQHAIIPLEDELNALKLYIELELTRLNNKFTYSITVDEAVDIYDCRIPALLLQPIVENAIWHGLAPLKEGGELDINICKDGQNLRIEIADTGIGRAAARKNIKKINEKHSLKIIKERLKLLEHYFGESVSLEIDDNCANNILRGTRVIIISPYFIEQNIFN